MSRSADSFIEMSDISESSLKLFDAIISEMEDALPEYFDWGFLWIPGVPGVPPGVPPADFRALN